MRLMSLLPIVFAITGTNVLGALPLGLKCDPTIKVVDAEVGQVGTYEVQKGMKKDKLTAFVNRQKVSPVDGCSFADLVPGQTVTMRYTGPEVSGTQVQCIDLANNNAPVEFPKSIYTVRVPNHAPHYLMPLCPDGTSSDGFPCSKLETQSERGSEYRDTVMKWKANDPKTKQYKIDLQFDPAYVLNRPPHTPSVPYGAKLFCAAVNGKGEVVISGTASYPAAAGGGNGGSSASPANPSGNDQGAARQAAAPGQTPPAAAPAVPTSPAAALEALGRLRPTRP